MGLLNLIFGNLFRNIIREELSAQYEIQQPLIGFVQELPEEDEDEYYDE